jgi:hypothetical protein
MGDFKPSNLYVGVVELFSVLLPGALLLAAIVLAVDRYAPHLVSDFVLSEPAQWAAFGLAAYALGALVFPIASGIDAAFYDPYRQGRWPRENDHAYAAATRLRRKFLRRTGDTAGDRPMNTFAWAKSLLLFRAPEAYNDVLRYEAESKFFRSLIVVMPLVGLLAAARWADGPPLVVVSLPLAGAAISRLSFHRYAERRYKSTEWAYRYAIVLLADAGVGPARKAAAE